jgi:hypothetical protein
LQVLEGVDGLYLAEEFGEPLNAGFRLAFLKVFEEVGNLVLADGAIEDGIALDDRDLDFVDTGEEKGFPLVFFAGLNCQAVIRMARAHQLRELLERGGLFVF